ncbi:MAG TPA: hypothetical protein DD473_05990, partial [Planctomycetaceae bacterium]|nr:hypothetical protein [Planctomycetaceae bacterium]
MFDMRFLLICFAVYAVLISANVFAENVVDYQKDILPIISNHCYTCHGPDSATRESGLRLDQR